MAGFEVDEGVFFLSNKRHALTRWDADPASLFMNAVGFNQAAFNDQQLRAARQSGFN